MYEQELREGRIKEMGKQRADRVQGETDRKGRGTFIGLRCLRGVCGQAMSDVALSGHQG